MDLQLSGKTAIVFGAAKGIGQAVADAFSAEGASVFRTDLEAIDSADSAVVDICDFDAVNRLVAEVGNEWGKIDHVVSAAAIGSGKFGFPFWNLDPEDWRGVLDVTLTGSINVAHACQSWLRKGESEGRTMLFFTSVAGQIGSQTDPPYSAAKAGIINFVQCAAKDLAPFGIRVNAISPGMVKTSLNQSVWESSQTGLSESERQSYEEWAEEKIKSIAPLGRWQEPGEFGAMSVYLASTHARNITGQTINIDGGQVMHS